MKLWRFAILPFRWPLLPVWASVVVAGAWAGKRARDPEPAQPPPPPVEEPAAEETTAPAPPPAPEAAATGPLFAQGLPLTELALPEGLANPTAQQCTACHAQIHGAWAAGAHASAWEGERWNQAVRDASEPTACLACHLPIAAQHPRRVVALTEGQLDSPRHELNPVWSPSLQREGVTCAACHLRDGAIVGPRASESAPHPVVQSDALGSPGLCAACHQLTWPGAQTAWYDTYGEWYRSAYREAGIRCQDCHMPLTAGTPTTGRFAGHASHALALDPGQAVSLLVELASPEVVRGEEFTFTVRVQNTGAGHAFPTGQPGHALYLSAVVVDGKGQPLHEPLEKVLERSVADEPPFAVQQDTRVPARGELTLVKTTTIPQKKPAGPARLRVTIAASRGGAPLVERSFPLTVL
ncbi:MAG: multiheme c-type cytochrome [Pseudomonadota bacterium]